MARILDQLREEHETIARLMGAVEQQSRRIADGEPPDYELLESIAEYCLDYPYLTHHPTEDALQRQLEIRDPETARSLGDLSGSHHELFDQAQAFAETIRELQADTLLTRDQVVARIQDFVARYRTHMAEEESGLFAAAEKCLQDADWAQLERNLADHPNASERDSRHQAIRARVLDIGR